MKCAEFHEKLSVRLDGELTQPEVAALEKHMSACDGCLQFYARMTHLDEHLRNLPIAVARRDLASKVKTELFAKKKRVWDTLPSSAWRTVPVLTIALVLALGLGNLVGKSMTGLLVEGQYDARNEFLALDTDNSLADAVFDLGSEENSR